MADQDRKCCKPNCRRKVKEGGYCSRGPDQYLWTARIPTVLGMGGLRCGLFESCTKRSHPESGVALHGTAADRVAVSTTWKLPVSVVIASWRR